MLKKALGKEALCQVPKIKHSAKNFFAECFIVARVFCVALDKELLCRVLKKTLDKILALGKEPNSGSVTHWCNKMKYQCIITKTKLTW
jgi:hypothetical protein